MNTHSSGSLYSSVYYRKILKSVISTRKPIGFDSEGLGDMENLTNKFSVLEIDVADDELPPPSTAGNRGSSSSTATGTRRRSGKSSTDGVLAENGNHEESNTQVPSVELKLPLVWIDVQTTGLNVEVDRILEIACIITDGNLNKSVEGPNLVVHHPQEYLEQMDGWCQDHHRTSGLTREAVQSTITETEAEKQVIKFVKRYIAGSHRPLLAGNVVYMDFWFLKKYMPELASLFSHVLVDVSSVRSLCYRWYPKEFEKAPPREEKLRAVEDIRQSIAELKYYKESIFKPKLKK